MTLNFEPLGINDEEAGKIGLAKTLTCLVVGISVANVSDRFKNHFKVPYYLYCSILYFAPNLIPF